MTRAHRLLHVFSTFAAGGPQVRTTDLFNRLPEGFEHTVVAMDGVFDAAERVQEHVSFRTLDPPSRVAGWKAPLQLAKFLKAQQPDLLLTYNWGAIESVVGARIAGLRRVIHAEDGFGPDEAEGQKARRVWFRRVVLRWVSQLVVPSQVLEDVARDLWRAPKQRTRRIPNGIDLTRFCPDRRAAARAELGIPPEVTVVGTVASLRPEKALELMLESFSAFCSEDRLAQLWVVGEGPERPQLEARAKELGISGNVRFTGPLSDPSTVFQALDLFALSSLTEQMPISVVEAMGCGLPVVSTKVGDVHRMVAESCREFILDSRDPRAHAETWKRLMLAPELRGRIGRDQRLRCEEEYDASLMLRRYEELYRGFLPSSASAR